MRVSATLAILLSSACTSAAGTKNARRSPREATGAPLARADGHGARRRTERPRRKQRRRPGRRVFGPRPGERVAREVIAARSRRGRRMVAGARA